MCDRLNYSSRLNSQWRLRHSGVIVKELNTVWLIQVLLHLMRFIIRYALCMKKKQLAFNLWYCALQSGAPYGPENTVITGNCSSSFTPQVKQARNQWQNFIRKSISRNTTHRQSYHLQAMLTGVKRSKAKTRLPIPALLTFLCLVCTQCSHILLRKSNTGETQTPKQFTDNYCICSPYRSVE